MRFLKKHTYKLFLVTLSFVSIVQSCTPVPIGGTTTCDPNNPPTLTTTTPSLGNWQGTKQTVQYLSSNCTKFRHKSFCFDSWWCLEFIEQYYKR